MMSTWLTVLGVSRIRGSPIPRELGKGEPVRLDQYAFAVDIQFPRVTVALVLGGKIPLDVLAGRASFQCFRRSVHLMPAIGGHNGSLLSGTYTLFSLHDIIIEHPDRIIAGHLEGFRMDGWRVAHLAGWVGGNDLTAC